jgi:glycosyltransferase involved in cell wall biosynthesis
LFPPLDSSAAPIGLIGPFNATGVGHENRRMWRKLPAARALASITTRKGYDGWEGLLTGDLPRSTAILPVTSGYPWQRLLDAFLVGLRSVVAVERTWGLLDSFPIAKARGIRTVLLVNAEAVAPDAPWFKFADALVARTKHGADELARRGLGSKTTYVPCPIDLDEFPFRLRAHARLGVFSNGFGLPDDRKGARIVLRALAEKPFPLRVYAQNSSVLQAFDTLDLAPFVATFGPVAHPAEMYVDADFAVQPSRYEGVGMAFLEAMASGLPVFTVDWPPMNEYARGAHGDAAKYLLARVAHVDRQSWPAAAADASDLAQKISTLLGADTCTLSAQARNYIEMIHGERAWQALRDVING